MTRSDWAGAFDQAVADSTPFGGATPTEFPSLDGPPVDYVIITSEELEDSFQELADWKTEKGVPAVIRTVEWIGENFAGSDIQEKIRTFIIDAYELWGTDWVLLGGDTEVIPPRYFWESDGESNAPRDVYYGGLDGTWNKERDYRIGYDRIGHDDIDVADPYWDVWLGRLPVRTTDEVEDVAAKLFSYVRKPGVTGINPRLGFYTSFLAFTGMTMNSSWPPGDETQYMRNQLWKAYHIGRYVAAPNGFDTLLFLEDVWDAAICSTCFGATRDTMLEVHEDWATEWNINALEDSLEAGYGLVYHHEHSSSYMEGGASACGSSAGGCVGDEDCDSAECRRKLKEVNQANQSFGLTRGDIDALSTPKGSYSVMYSGGCKVNAYDFDSVSEHWIRDPDGGAVAYVGGTRKKYSEDVASEITFFEVLLDDDVQHIGQTLAFTVAEGPTGGGPSLSLALRRALLGDPEMPVWTAEPSTFDTLDIDPSSITTLGPQTIALVVESDGSAVKNALVCLKQSDDCYATGSTDSNGEITFYDLDVRSQANVIVTVTKENFIPERETLTVTGTQSAFVNYAGHEATETAGNRNDRLEAGDDFDLTVEVQNSGDTDIEDTVKTELFVSQPVSLRLLDNGVTYPLAIGSSNAEFVSSRDSVLWFPANDVGIRAEGKPVGVGSSAGTYLWKEPSDSLRWSLVVTGSTSPLPGGNGGPAPTPIGLAIEGRFRTPEEYPGFRSVTLTGVDTTKSDVVTLVSDHEIYFKLYDDSDIFWSDYGDTIQFIADEAAWITIEEGESEIESLDAGGTDDQEFEISVSPNIPDEHEVVFTIISTVDSDSVGVADFLIDFAAPVLELSQKSTREFLCMSPPNHDCYYLDVEIQNVGGGDADTVGLKFSGDEPEGLVPSVDSVTYADLASGERAVITGLKFSIPDTEDVEDVVIDLTASVVFDRGEEGDVLTYDYPNLDFDLPDGQIDGLQLHATSAKSVTVWWDTLATTDLEGYYVFRRDTTGQAYNRLNDEPIINASLYEDTGLTPAKEYWYKVAAIDTSWNVFAESDTASRYTWPPIEDGWPKHLPLGSEASPLVVDADNDGTMEVFVATDKIYAWSADGDPYESTDGVFFDSLVTSPASQADSLFQASLAAADIDRDDNGKLEIIAAASHNLYVLEHDGTKKFHKYAASKFAAPVIANLDATADTFPEIVTGSSGNWIYAWDHDGSTYLPNMTNGKFANVGTSGNSGSVAVTNLDSDDTLEVIHSPGSGGVIKAYKAIYSSLSGEAKYHWGYDTGMVTRIWKCALGDVDGDGEEELVFAQGGDANHVDRTQIVVLEAAGDTLATYLLYHYPDMYIKLGKGEKGPPMALADLDGDDDVELIIPTMNRSAPGDSGKAKGTILVLDVDVTANPDALVMTKCYYYAYSPLVTDDNADVYAGVVVADVDSDDELEIAVSTSDFGVHFLEWDDEDSTCVEDERAPWLYHTGEVFATPVIGNFDSDNHFELLVQDMGGGVFMYDLGGTYSTDKLEWARYGNDPQNSGRYGSGAYKRESQDESLDGATTRLAQNYPNPFNPLTRIAYDVGKAGHVRLRVFDVVGRKVATLIDVKHRPGSHHVMWDGRNDSGRELASGVYFYQIEVGGVRESRKLLILR